MYYNHIKNDFKRNDKEILASGSFYNLFYTKFIDIYYISTKFRSTLIYFIYTKSRSSLIVIDLPISYPSIRRFDHTSCNSRIKIYDRVSNMNELNSKAQFFPEFNKVNNGFPLTKSHKLKLLQEIRDIKDLAVKFVIN